MQVKWRVDLCKKEIIWPLSSTEEGLQAKELHFCIYLHNRNICHRIIQQTTNLINVFCLLVRRGSYSSKFRVVVQNRSSSTSNSSTSLSSFFSEVAITSWETTMSLWSGSVWRRPWLYLRSVWTSEQNLVEITPSQEVGKVSECWLYFNSHLPHPFDFPPLLPTI